MSTAPTTPSSPQSFDLAAWLALSPVQRTVAMVLALGAEPRPRRWIYDFLPAPQARLYGLDVRPALASLLDVLRELEKRGWVVAVTNYGTELWGLVPQAVAVVYPALLEQLPVAALRQHLAHADDYGLDGYWAKLGRLPSMAAGVALARLEALSGSPRNQVEAVMERLPFSDRHLGELMDRAVISVVDADLLPMMDPSMQAGVLLYLADQQNTSLQTVPFDYAGLMQEYLATESGQDTWDMRQAWAMQLMLRGQLDAMSDVLAPIPSLVQAGTDKDQLRARQYAETLLACRDALQGHWEAAERRFATALALHRRYSTARKSVLHGTWGTTCYIQVLLRQPTPERLEQALKYLRTELGKREVTEDCPEGFLAQAILMRQGELPMNTRVFQARSMSDHVIMVSMFDLWRWLARAWLKTGAETAKLSAADYEAHRTLRGHFERVGALTLVSWLDSALAILEGKPTAVPFFVQESQPSWQATLSALRAAVSGAAAEAATPQSTERLVWVLTLESDGSVLSLVPHEQKYGQRGWGRPKEVPLSRLQRKPETVASVDTRLAATLRQDTSTRTLRLDLSEALPALVGHPHVAIHPEVEQLVELSEALPEMDVTRQAGRAGEPDVLQVQMVPYIDVGSYQAYQKVWVQNPAHQKELEAAQAIRVLRDGTQRAKLYRLNPAQRRVALLLGPKGLTLPPEGATELEQVLAGMGAHFPVHSDTTPVQASRELPADARLRAELQPEGEGLVLRLVAAPFGPDYPAAPRPIPGQGRSRLVVAIGGETLGVQRDLAAESEHLNTVLDACPMLAPPPEGAPCEWHLQNPDEALALLERLPTLNALQGLDWPKGQPVRVDSASLGQLKLSLHTGREWFELQGELAVDEQLVMSLQKLMQISAGRRSRFVPLGEGRYLALTQELRERLDDLAAVAEPGKNEQGLAALWVPPVAAPWLEQATAGTQLTVDEAFTERLQRLEASSRQVPALPATLQASLRPYQEEGFEWAMRLSQAGLGACLADDMGLGKTLQALAVLLARAHLGPALVVAPTSLLGNWRAEARKFAPSLRVRIHAEGGPERTAQIEKLSAGQVLLVSYPMVQIDQEAFVTKRWATLVLDEAQAIKNAAAKRSQAVFELQADFRLALSGTPIENRLAELWSIMRACNPGLLGSVQRFNERFAGPIERQRDRTAQRILRRLIAPFILRRTKSQVLSDLPPRTELIYKVEPDAGEQAHYEALRREVLAATEASLMTASAGEAHFNVLAGLTKLRRAACDPRLVNPQFGTVGAKVQAFGELAAELVANGHKALVFSQFVDFLALLKEPLDAAGIRYQYLDGSTPTAERTRRVDAFQAGEGELFLISLKAGGFGLNLTVADYVVIADPWWNPATEDQAAGRAHRMGQQRPVTVYRLVNEGTLENKIIALHQQKRELADLLLEGNETATVPDAQALLSLMRGENSAAEDDAEDLPSL